MSIHTEWRGHLQPHPPEYQQYTQIQQDLYDDALEDNPDNNIKEPEPLYRWYYRPELPDLKVKRANTTSMPKA